ncbi:hypothetical protein PS2_030388 [Malus domestica]
MCPLGAKSDGKTVKTFELFDLSSKRTYHHIGSTHLIEEGRGLIANARLHASKYGWLLFSAIENLSGGARTAFFFFNPFCNQILEMPPLDLNTGEKVGFAIFTTTPTSPNCFILVLGENITSYPCSKGYSFIFTYNSTEKRWRSVRGNYDFNLTEASDIAYVDGILYVRGEYFFIRLGCLGYFTSSLETMKKLLHAKRIFSLRTSGTLFS